MEAEHDEWWTTLSLASGLCVPYREIRQRGVFSRDENSKPLDRLDSIYPPTPPYQNIGTIKKNIASRTAVPKVGSAEP